MRQKSYLVLSQIISYTKGYQTYFQIISLQRATLLPQYAFLSLHVPRETCSKDSALLGQLLSVTTFGCKIDYSVKVFYKTLIFMIVSKPKFIMSNYAK